MANEIRNKYVTFKLDKEHYGVPIINVLSIEKPGKTTRIPNAPDYVIGLINLRGDVIPVIDLRLRLGMTKNSLDNNSRVIIVKESDIVVGLMVDSSKEVLEIDDDNIDKPPTNEDNSFVNYISGIGKIDNRLIVILDLKKVLNIKE